MTQGSFIAARLVRFCYGHRLLNYEGKCRHPHGHNGLLEIAVRAEKLDGRGMAVDFEEIKSSIGRWVDEAMDHKMLLNKADPLAAALKKMGEPVFEMEENPTAENIARLVYEQARKAGLDAAWVRLWETDNSFAEYRGR